MPVHQLMNSVYRDYHIRYVAPDWLWQHKDYDGPPDRRCGASRSPEAAREDIDENISFCENE